MAMELKIAEPWNGDGTIQRIEWNHEELKQELLEYCSGHIAKYAMPREIEFRKELPKTLVGKVAYRMLEEEELQRIHAAESAQDAPAQTGEKD